jgi:hypothetical protein
VVEGGKHNDTWRVGGDTYRERMNKFMNESRTIMNKIRHFNLKMEMSNKEPKVVTPHKGHSSNDDL